MKNDPKVESDILLDDDGSDIGADDWANPSPESDWDDVPVFDRGRMQESPDRLFDDINDFTWG